MNPARKKWLYLVCLLLLIAAGYYTRDRLSAVPNRVALPWSASDIEEELTEFGLLPDFHYVLKARLPEQDFAVYAKRLGLVPWQQTSETMGIDWTTSSQQPWWTPSPATERTWYHHDGDFYRYAKWEAGWVYVCSFER